MVQILSGCFAGLDSCPAVRERVEELFTQVLKGFEYHIVGEYPVEYRCYCDRQRVEEAISCIEKAELYDIAGEGKDISVSCQFCDAVYSFSPDELRAMADKKIEEN